MNDNTFNVADDIGRLILSPRRVDTDDPALSFASLV